MLVITRFATHLSCLNPLLDCTVNLPAFSMGVLECCRNSDELPHVIHCQSSPGGGGSPWASFAITVDFGEQAVAVEALF